VEVEFEQAQAALNPAHWLYISSSGDES
jgi:hypothetical protein